MASEGSSTAQIPALADRIGKILRCKFVRSLSLPLVCFHCHRVNQCPVGIKGFKQAGFVQKHIGVQAFERILADKERPFHCAIMTPEMNGTSSAIKHSALVREVEHGSFLSVRHSLLAIQHFPKPSEFRVHQYEPSGLCRDRLNVFRCFLTEAKVSSRVMYRWRTSFAWADASFLSSSSLNIRQIPLSDPALPMRMGFSQRGRISDESAL